MGFFSRKNKILDLTEDYTPQRRLRSKENSDTVSSNDSSSKTQESSTGGFFDNFFGSSSVSSNSTSGTVGDIGNSHHGNFDPETGKPLNPNFDEKKRRLAMRLKSMTDRIEELSNQVYQLQQKIELLEKKINSPRH